MDTGRTQKAIKNILYNMGNQLLGIILAFVSRTVFINCLGISYLGLNGLFSDVLGMLSLTDLGIGTAVVFSYYKPLAENDFRKINALIYFYKKVYKIIAIVTLFVGIILLPFLPHIVNLDDNIRNINLYYLLSLLNIVVSYLYVYKTSLLIADQKNYIIVRINMIVSILTTLVQIISLLLFSSFACYLFVAIIATLSKNIIASIVANKSYSFSLKSEMISQDEKKDILNNISSVFIYKISSVLLNMTDNVLISVIVGTIAVGYYSNYLLLSNKITQFYALIFSSLVASIGNLIVKESAEKRYSVFQVEQTISFIISCIVFPCFIMLSNDFISLWLGNEYALDIKITIAIGMNLYLACVYHPLWSYREATGLYKKTKWIMLICGILNIILSIILGILFGMLGVIIASCISRMSTYVLVEPRILFSEYFETDAIEFYKSVIFNMIIVAVASLIAWMCTKNIEVSNWGMWVWKAFIIGMIGIVFSLIFYRKSKGMLMINERVRNLWKR